MKRILDILKDTTSGVLTDEERVHIHEENLLREAFIREKLKSEIAAFIASSEYKNASGIRRMIYYLKYHFYLDKSGNIILPKHEIESLARCFLPDIHSFFESDEGKKEFEEWKASQLCRKILNLENEAS